MIGPRVIVALDFEEASAALALVARLSPSQCRLKVGLELFTHAGPSMVTALVERGFDVFLDLKYHDIPTTVARACAAAARLQVWMLNVHALGGGRMLAAARAAIASVDVPRRPLLVGVTLLTSHDAEELTHIGLVGAIEAQVERLAAAVQAQGLDGVVCAPNEAMQLRRKFGAEFKLVTPGIRPAGSGADDQRRTLTPLEALKAGADYLVVGRPVTRAADPAAILKSISEELVGYR